MNNMQQALAVGNFEMIGNELLVTHPVPPSQLQNFPAWAALRGAPPQPQPPSREEQVEALLRQVSALRNRNEELENSRYEETAEARRAGFLLGLATKVKAIEEAQRDIGAQIQLNESLVQQASRLQEELSSAEIQAKRERLQQVLSSAEHERNREHLEQKKKEKIAQQVEQLKQQRGKELEVSNGLCFGKNRGDTSKLGKNWAKKYAMLKAFVEENGHAKVPPTEGKIYYWLCNQRRRFRVNLNPTGRNPSSYSPLTQEEMKKLVELGVNLNTPSRPKAAEKRRVKRMERDACAALSELARTTN